MKAKFNEINSIEKLETIFAASKEKPVLIFKHSTSCPISAHVYEEMQNVEGDVNLIVVQTARAVSNEVAARTGIRHETPQAIVIENGKPLFHAAHYDVTAEEVNGKLKTSSMQD